MNHPSAPPRSTDGQGLAPVVVGVGVCSALHVGKFGRLTLAPETQIAMFDRQGAASTPQGAADKAA